MDIVQQKSELRQLIAQRLQLVSETEYKNRDVNICKSVFEGIDWSGVRKLCIYRSRSTWHEPNMELLQKNIATSYPNIEIDVLPQHADSPIPHKQYEVIVLPLMAWDGQGNRLGRGKGWYDRFLSIQKHAFIIGVGYDEQQVARVPALRHDRVMTAICTQTELRHFA